MREIVIIGAGGLGREVAWLIEDINKNGAAWTILGFVDDDASTHGRVINGYPVLGGIDWLRDKQLNVTLAIGNPLARKTVLAKLEGSHNTYPVLVHPTSVVAPSAMLCEGVVICAGCIVSVDATLHSHVFVNLSCTIGHDDVIEKCCVINPGVNLSGHVRLEACVNVGTGAAIIQGIAVGARTTIGAGAVVVRDLPPDCTAVGAPARPIKFRS